MMLEWHSEFDAGQMLWLTAAAIGVLLMLLPACVLLFTGGAWPLRRQGTLQSWITGGALHVALWIVVLHSLAFGPSLGTSPADVGEIREMQGLEQMIREAAEVVDQRPFFGRGGFIGDLAFAGFRHMEPQGNADRPMFSARRPYGKITLASFLTFQLAVYLCGVGSVSAVAGQSGVSSLRLGMFSLGWGLLVYAPAAHWVWGEGWLGVRYALDAGGGLFVVLAGAAVLVLQRGRADMGQNAANMVEPSWWDRPQALAVGAVLFWLSFPVLMASLRVPTAELRSLILLNALAAGSGGFLFCGLLRLLAPTAGGSSLAAEGLITGLAAVAGGCVLYEPLTALICGAGGAAVGWALWIVASRWFRWGAGETAVMLTGGSFFGVVAVGVFGNSGNGVFHWDGKSIDGLLYDNSQLVVIQLLAACCVAGWSAGCTWVLGKILLRAN
jgi:ammonia channel protein AmtB